MRKSPRKEPLQFITGSTFDTIWCAMRDMASGSWIERFLALFVGPLLVFVVCAFLPILLFYDLTVLGDRALSPGALSASEPRKIRVGERETQIFPAAEGVGLRCAYCHEGQPQYQTACSAWV